MPGSEGLLFAFQQALLSHYPKHLTRSLHELVLQGQAALSLCGAGGGPSAATAVVSVLGIMLSLLLGRVLCPTGIGHLNCTVHDWI